MDGAHIRTLLLTLIYRYMPIIGSGYVYIAHTLPSSSGKFIKYLDADEELDAAANIQHHLSPLFNDIGLGEMDASQL